MSLAVAERSASLGAQHPRIFHSPGYVQSAGVEAVELAEMAGLILDPWQRLVLEHGLGERSDGSFQCFEVGVCVPRQNGKGSIIEALELAGLFVLRDKLTVHSAHLFDTSKEAMRRLVDLIDGCSDLSRHVKRVVRSHGEEGIELTTGERVRFRTRTKGGGRGLTGDRVILDEAMFLPETSIGALLPTLSARPNSQAWYFGSAVDQMVHDDGVAFARIRERGTAGTDPRLAYMEWSADMTIDECDRGTLNRPELWSAANPALNIRIDEDHVAAELRSMDPRTFAVERLGVGDWPATDGAANTVISLDKWDALADSQSQISGHVWFAADVTPDRQRSSIAAAGRRGDGLLHVELIDRRTGTGWVLERVRDLAAKYPGSVFLCDQVSPAASFIRDLEDAGVPVTSVSSQEHAQACGTFFDMVEQAQLRHLGQDEMRAALRGAAARPLGDAWAWSRKNSTFDISPLVACTLAGWAATRQPAGPWTQTW